MIRAGIIGGAGYTAGELLRVLQGHPQVKVDFVYSTSQSGKAISAVHQDLIGETDICFTDKLNLEVDVLFLCLGHGNSKQFLATHPFSEQTRIIDLSTDFRIEAKDHSFVYGLPEFFKKEIRDAKKVANPGCFATAISLAILPLAAENRLTGEVHVNAVTGATGAGTALSGTSHFSWRNNNFSAYKAFEHQHLAEIQQSLNWLQKKKTATVNLIPNRGNFSRGIHATAYTEFSGSIEEAKDIFRRHYDKAAFTFITEEEVHLKQVVNTNKCVLRLQKFGTKLLITSVIDNLLKGASGQAIQNMNLMFDLDESSGLKLKANYF